MSFGGARKWENNLLHCQTNGDVSEHCFDATAAEIYEMRNNMPELHTTRTRHSKQDNGL